MTTDQLYINDEKFGSVSYVGTWDQWERGMEPNLRVWYDEYVARLDDGDEPASYEDWRADAMEESLTEATAEEIASYDRLDS